MNASGDTTDDGSGYDATPFLPARGRLPAHRKAAADCRGCPLFANATQTVFGSGDPAARIMLVGEQPGDQEDRQGEPFVGPAGRLLQKALDEAGLGDEPRYLTNAVKHFNFVPAERGKRRIHKPPSIRDMTACRPWLTAELRLVAPEVVVALGATAGRALLGRSFKVTRDRGTAIPLPPMDDDGAGHGDSAADGASTVGDGRSVSVVATLHPSAVLRADDREAALAGLVADLQVAVRLLT
jgi:uracil-DNA glycosylase family protein